MAVGQPSNFNSPAAGSAWWAEVYNATDQKFVASQGKNVYADFKSLLRYRSPEAQLSPGSGIDANDLRELEEYFSSQTPSALSAFLGLGGGGSVSEDMANALSATLEQAAQSGRMSPQAMRIILWFTYGMNNGNNGSTPLGVFAVASDTIFPPLGASPPAVAADALMTPLRWGAANPIPAQIRPTLATTPGTSDSGSTPAPTNSDGSLAVNTGDLVTDLHEPFNWMLWGTVGAVALVVVGGVGYYMYKKNEEKKYLLGSGAYAGEYEEFDYEEVDEDDDDDASAMEWHRSGYRRMSRKGR